MKNKKIMMAAIAFVAVIAILAGLWFATRPETEEGSKTITVVVVHANGEPKTFTYHTDKEYLGELLYAEGLIKAENVDEGMFNVADGEKAEGNAYWALYQGDAYAEYGVDDTVIRDGDVFKLVYTVWAG